MLLQSTLFFASLSCGASFVPSPSTSTTTSSHRSHHAAAFEFRAVVASTTRSTTVSSMRMNNHEYSAEWIDLLSSNSYSYPATPSSQSASSTSSPIELPRKMYPPRSGGLSFTTPDNSKLFSFAGYAEEITPSTSAVDRFVVNDLWEFISYYQNENESSTSKQQWGWNKILQNEVKDFIPGPRLATALAVLPPSSSAAATDRTEDKTTTTTTKPTHAILLGGWDPQTPGTGGVILDDVSMLDMETLKWSSCITSGSEGSVATIPGGPTSRHVAVSLSIPSDNDVEGKSDRRNVICLHNHRCEDHVLLLSTMGGTAIQWERQYTSGEAPSSRGLHCAASIHNSQSMVIFGGNMSNEAFVLDTATWKWTKLDCGGSDQHLPSPRAGACLCPLDNDSVLLFGGAIPSSGGLAGLNDVWILTVDLERGIGKWECLIENAEDGNENDGTLRPPGRNAASLCPIDVEKLLPRNIMFEKSGSKSVVKDDGKDSSYFLLNVSPVSSACVCYGYKKFRPTDDDTFYFAILQ